MMNYDPNAESLPSTMTVDEELARQAGQRGSEPLKSVPQGLLKFEPEKNIDESQMADFSTSIDDLVEPMGQSGSRMDVPPIIPSMQQPGPSPAKKKSAKSPRPFNLTEEQFQALVAGVSAIAVFSKPIQGKLRTMVPKFIGESGDVSLTGLIAMGLLVAIIFYFARQAL